jgi:hypothetical protein
MVPLGSARPVNSVFQMGTHHGWVQLLGQNAFFWIPRMGNMYILIEEASVEISNGLDSAAWVSITCTGV